MNKCNIDGKSLKLIQSRVATIFREYLKNESTQEELKKKINKCKDIELSSISLDDVDELTDIKIDNFDINQDVQFSTYRSTYDYSGK